MRSAVLFLVFNRPDTTRQVFEAIRLARPPRLYIAADGPRKGRLGEVSRCSEVREIATSVDWPCEVKTLFQTENLGCKFGPAGGIDWFFENEEEGVILEDDVLPLPGFFDFCDVLLQRYRDDARIGMISGCNFVSKDYVCKDSYFFSNYNHIWGWASWRRAWKQYDLSMKLWPEWRDAGGLKRVSNGDFLFEHYWRKVFDEAEGGLLDAWDYQWAFTCWSEGLVSILPKYNQIRNLGFGEGATHTTAEAPSFILESPPRALSMPLTHPDNVAVDYKVEKLITALYGVSFFGFVKSKIKNVPVVHYIFDKIKASGMF